MVKQIIPADKSRVKTASEGENFLNISEFFYDSVQGEGVYTGSPAAFLRLQHCTLSCRYCDTTEVWKHGSPYSFDELFRLIEGSDIREQLINGQHLVITGGSPLLQQSMLLMFLSEFVNRYGFKPFIEIENEAVIMPFLLMENAIDCWNNSPKLSSSGVNSDRRRAPEVVKRLSQLDNSWFKFVIDCEQDWTEIEMCFLFPKLIKLEQIILMPEGVSREELNHNRQRVLEMAVKHGVRYSDRLHIQIWDKKVGV